MKIDKWKKCYPSNWQGKIVPDAITHPAKYSSKLIRKVYDHLFEEGWIQEGGWVHSTPCALACPGAGSSSRKNLFSSGMPISTCGIKDIQPCRIGAEARAYSREIVATWRRSWASRRTHPSAARHSPSNNRAAESQRP
jgi:hypothetical protein